MTEYIEKQLVLSKSQHDYLEARYDYDDFVLVSDIESIQPADVRPVEVGLWLRVGNTGLASCRCGFITDRYSTYRYCPNCGRKNGGVEYGG